jgi:hypothetical protein
MFGRDTDSSTDSNDQTHLAPTMPAVDTPATDLSTSAAEIAAAASHGGQPVQNGFNSGSLNAALANANDPSAAAMPPTSAPVIHPTVDHSDELLHDDDSPEQHSASPDVALGDESESSTIPVRVAPSSGFSSNSSSNPNASSTPVPSPAPEPAGQPAGSFGSMGSAPDPMSGPKPVSAPAASTMTLPSPLPGDIQDIKRQALMDLSPLVGHLDLSPEEKFRTTMMMLQSTDEPSMLKDAYAAAQAIPDEKIRAHALLDVVNEINFFEQQGKPVQ